MAVSAQTRIPNASKADADRFDEAMEAAMMQSGGPPAGLMVHICAPVPAGFQVTHVWRNDAEMRSFYHEVMFGTLADLGLVPEATETSAVWSFARP